MCARVQEKVFGTESGSLDACNANRANPLPKALQVDMKRPVGRMQVPVKLYRNSASVARMKDPVMMAFPEPSPRLLAHARFVTDLPKAVFRDFEMVRVNH